MQFYNGYKKFSLSKPFVVKLKNSWCVNQLAIKIIVCAFVRLEIVHFCKKKEK